MAASTEFCLLGPLAVRRGDALVLVRPGKQRAVLAALLLNANRAVSVDELAEALWGSSPPPSARVTVQNYVKRLRQALGDADGTRISTRPGGYVIEVGAGELDAALFEELLGDARAAARYGLWDTAAQHARAALALWRGEPLTGVESELLAEREVPRLTDLRLRALETRIEADVHLGRPGEVIWELRRLAATHTLREHLHALLMLALYLDGRQAEALAAYQCARDVLVEELGAEPGPELQQLHQQILRADPALIRTGPATPAASAAPPAGLAPRQLPAAVAGFTGRAAELAALTGLLGHPDKGHPGTVVISAIGGTAGVGKTALAVHWAHQVAGQFPDGQLYMNLRGYDPARPVPATDALAAFLRSLGVPGTDIPADESERAARYRSLLAGKRMLIVLDNAGSADQVRPLLPGTGACIVVVTSRDTLAGLAARDGASRLDLDVLPPDDAVALLRELIGERADADPAAAAALAGQCCRLPLALRVAAELAATRPATPLAALAGELADLRTRLDLLETGGDPRTQVRAVFSWSCRHLGTAAARAFRLAGLHPGPDLDPFAAAALTGTTVPQARQALDTLARAHLLSPAAPGRYGLHDLLRAYAGELTAAQDNAQEQHTALTRLFDYYLHTAIVAMDALFPTDSDRRPRIPQPAAPCPEVKSLAGARDWLDAELATLVAGITYAAGHGWPAHATQLAAVLFRYLQTAGRYPEAIVIYTHAARAARSLGDPVAEADALNALGLFDWRQGRLEQATNLLQQSAALYRQARDRTGQARALGNLGIVEGRMGRHEQATSHHEQALSLYEETGNLYGKRITLNNLSVIEHMLGHGEQAAGYLHQALSLCRELGDPQGEANAHSNLGAVEVLRGHYDQAEEHLSQALSMHREQGDRWGEARALDELGTLRWHQGRHEQAAEYLRQAASKHHQMGDLTGHAKALNDLGKVLLSTGDLEQARAQHVTALTLASQAGCKNEEAQAHDGLADTYHAAGEKDPARAHWQQALAIYTALAVPEATQVSTKLDEISRVLSPSAGPGMPPPD